VPPVTSGYPLEPEESEAIERVLDEQRRERVSDPRSPSKA
jgi:hypothetical protein